MSLILVPLVISQPRGLSLTSLGVVCVELAMMGVGYAAALATFRRGREDRLEPSRRHSIGGLFAPAGLLVASVFAQGTNLAGIAIMSVAAGALIGTVLWARSFRNPPSPKPTLEDRERDADLALERAGVTLGDIIPIRREVPQPRDPVDRVA